MKINLLFVNLIVRKTFFSILILVFSTKGFSQFKQDTTIEYRDCIQFSPFMLIEPLTTNLNISWERHYRRKIYIAANVGFIINGDNLWGGQNTLEQSGTRLGIDIKVCPHRIKKTGFIRGAILCVGIEPFFKYVRSYRYGLFDVSDKKPRTDNYNVSYSAYQDSLILYTSTRTQIGAIGKANLKMTYKHFSLDIEGGIKGCYKIVTQGDVNKDYEYINSNRHNPMMGMMFGRYDGWWASPFINLKIGRRF